MHRSDASVFLETRVLIPAFVYVTNSITIAEFREMTNDEFKTTYLGPLNDAPRKSNIGGKYFLSQYYYP